MPSKIAYAIALYTVTILRLHRLTSLPSLPIPISKAQVKEKAQLKLAKRNKKYNAQCSRVPVTSRNGNTTVGSAASSTVKSKHVTSSRSVRGLYRLGASSASQPMRSSRPRRSRRRVSREGADQTSMTSLRSSLSQSVTGHEERERQALHQREQQALARRYRRRHNISRHHHISSASSHSFDRSPPDPSVMPSLTWRFLTALLPLLSVTKFTLPVLFIVDILLFYTGLVPLPPRMCLIPFVAVTLTNVAVNVLFIYILRSSHPFTRKRRLYRSVLMAQSAWSLFIVVSEAMGGFGIGWYIKLASVVLDVVIWIDLNEDILDKVAGPWIGSSGKYALGLPRRSHHTLQNTFPDSQVKSSKSRQRSQSRHYHHVRSKSALSSLSSISLFSKASGRSSRDVLEADEMIMSAPGRVEGVKTRKRRIVEQTVGPPRTGQPIPLMMHTRSHTAMTDMGRPNTRSDPGRLSGEDDSVAIVKAPTRDEISSQMYLRPSDHGAKRKAALDKHLGYPRKPLPKTPDGQVHVSAPSSLSQLEPPEPGRSQTPGLRPPQRQVRKRTSEPKLGVSNTVREPLTRPRRPIHPKYGIPATEAEPIYSPTLSSKRYTPNGGSQSSHSHSSLPSPKSADVSIEMPIPATTRQHSRSNSPMPVIPDTGSKGKLSALPVFRKVHVEKSEDEQV